MTKRASVYNCGCHGKDVKCRKDCKNDDEHEERCRMARKCLECDWKDLEKCADEERGKLSTYDRERLVDRYFLDRDSNTPRFNASEAIDLFLQTADKASAVKKVVGLYERAFEYKVSYDYNGKFGTRLKGDLRQFLELDDKRKDVKLVGEERRQRLKQLKKDILG